MAPTSEPIDIRRKRLRFQSWHRGIREMDLILGQFADALDAYETLLRVPDTEFYKWISGAAEIPENFRSAMLDRIMQLDYLDVRPGQG